MCDSVYRPRNPLSTRQWLLHRPAPPQPGQNNEQTDDNGDKPTGKIVADKEICDREDHEGELAGSEQSESPSPPVRPAFPRDLELQLTENGEPEEKDQDPNTYKQREGKQEKAEDEQGPIPPLVPSRFRHLVWVPLLPTSASLSHRCQRDRADYRRSGVLGRNNHRLDDLHRLLPHIICHLIRVCPLRLDSKPLIANDPIALPYLPEVAHVDIDATNVDA